MNNLKINIQNILNYNFNELNNLILNIKDMNIINIVLYNTNINISLTKYLYNEIINIVPNIICISNEFNNYNYISISNLLNNDLNNIININDKKYLEIFIKKIFLSDELIENLNKFKQKHFLDFNDIQLIKDILLLENIKIDIFLQYLNLCYDTNFTNINEIKSLNGTKLNIVMYSLLYLKNIKSIINENEFIYKHIYLTSILGIYVISHFPDFEEKLKLMKMILFHNISIVFHYYFNIEQYFLMKNNQDVLNILKNHADESSFIFFEMFKLENNTNKFSNIIKYHENISYNIEKINNSDLNNFYLLKILNSIYKLNQKNDENNFNKCKEDLLFYIGNINFIENKNKFLYLLEIYEKKINKKIIIL